MDSQNYQSLTDPHLNAYFNNKRIRRHLIKARLINRQGEILPAATQETTVVRREKERRARQELSHTITNYVIEEERRRQAFIRNYFDFAMKRSRIQKIRESKHQRKRSLSQSLFQPTDHSKTNRAPSPDRTKNPPLPRSPPRAKSARRPPVNVKNEIIHRPITAKQQVNDDHCEVTMIYYGPPNNNDQKKISSHSKSDEIMVMQQHCGGENLPVFKGFVRPNQIFTFDSRRHRDYPFALALYINGLVDSRISVCCEYKHKHNVRLGSKYGLFGIYDVKKSQPCQMCRFEQRKKQLFPITTAMTTIENRPLYRKPVLTTEFPLAILLRTPTMSPEREKPPLKREINRVSTVAQASHSPRRLSSVSLPNKTNNNEANQSNTSEETKEERRNSSSISTKSRRSSSTISFQEEEPHHSSEPVLIQKNTDDGRSSSRSTESVRTPRPASSTSKASSSSSTISFLGKNKNNHVRSGSSSSNFFSEKEDDQPALSVLSGEDQPEKQPSRPPSRASVISSSSSTISIRGKNKNNHVQSSSSSSNFFSEKENDQPALPVLPGEDQPEKELSRPPSRASVISSSSSTISLLGKNKNTHVRSSSSSSDFFSEKKDDQPALAVLPGEDQPEKELSRPPSRASVISSSSSSSSAQSKTKEDLTKEKYSSSSSSTTESDEDTVVDDKPPHSSTYSTDNEQENEIINESPQKSSTNSGDDEELPSNAVSHPNGNEEPLSTKTETTPKRQYRAVENIIVVWLNATLDHPDQATLDCKDHLRQIARTLRTFDNPQKCLQFLGEMTNDKIFLIVSDALSEAILDQIDDYSQLALVYLFAPQAPKTDNQLLTQYPKIKGVYSDIFTICEHLKIDAKQWDNDLSTFQISSGRNDESNFRLFIQNQLFKEYLLQISYDTESVQQLTEYCQKLYIENNQEMQLIDQFERDYRVEDALNWYSKDCFVYHMLNRAIRMKDIKILFQMIFLIHDIHQQLENVHSSTVYRSSLTVYRGQGMKREYFQDLQDNQGGLLAFNGFVSTSRKQTVADAFARRSLTNGFPIAVLFRIKIDPKATSIPFVSLENLSSNPSEYEVLLSFKAIFRIESIESIEENLYQVDLTLTEQIHPSIQIQSDRFNHLNGYEKLGELLIEMNELEKAKNLYEINIPNRSSSKYSYIYNQLAVIQTKLEVYNQALIYYHLALQTKCEETLNDYLMISNIHKEMGKILFKEKKEHEALEQFQCALDIQLTHVPATDLSLVEIYELLAMVYEANEDYETALEYHQKQLHIEEVSATIKPADIAARHLKIAICLKNLNRLNEAMDHLQQSIALSPSDSSQLDERQIILERIRELIE